MDRRSRRAAALLEVLGVYVAGGLVTDQLVRLSGVSVTNPFTTLNAQITGPELIAAARQIFLLLLFEYTGYFLLIVPLDWRRGRRGRAVYGLTTARRSWTWLLLAGLATAALSEWLVLGVGLIHSIHPSQTAPWRDAFFAMSWRRWEFWLFSAAASWALVPVVEELFYRGYCQRRLAEAWGDGPAIIGAACLFTFAHAQYQIPNAYNAGMILGLLLSAIGFGMVFAWTRSLIPAIIAHAIFDIPMTPLWQCVLLAALGIGAAFTWRRGRAIAGGILAAGSGGAYAMLALAAAGYAIAASRVHGLEYAAVAMVAIAIVLEARSRL